MKAFFQFLSKDAGRPPRLFFSVFCFLFAAMLAVSQVSAVRAEAGTAGLQSDSSSASSVYRQIMSRAVSAAADPDENQQWLVFAAARGGHQSNGSRFLKNYYENVSE